jgi:hypothetical protein
MKESTQVGGTHYSDMKMQPIEFITANNMNFIDGNMVKYASRHHAKNKDEDLKKVIHYAILVDVIDIRVHVTACIVGQIIDSPHQPFQNL